MLAVPANTGTVILPYLGKIGAFAVLCEAAARNRCTQDLVSQVIDPVNWFRQLGALRIVQVGPPPRPRSGAREAPRPPDLPDPTIIEPPASSEVLFRPVLLGPSRKEAKTKTVKRNGATYQSANVPSGSVIVSPTPTGQE